MAEFVPISINGRRVEVAEDTTVAVAILLSAVHAFRVSVSGQPRGFTPDGWAHVIRRCSPGGDWFEGWKAQAEASSNGCISIQTGYSELDNLIIANFNATPPFTAGWNVGQVLVGKDAASYFAALTPEAKAALAALVAGNP